jgi:hypothetical protein
LSCCHPAVAGRLPSERLRTEFLPWTHAKEETGSPPGRLLDALSSPLKSFVIQIVPDEKDRLSPIFRRPQVSLARADLLTALSKDCAFFGCGRRQT